MFSDVKQAYFSFSLFVGKLVSFSFSRETLVARFDLIKATELEILMTQIC